MSGWQGLLVVDPDRSVFQQVNRVLVGDRLVVDATVEPDGIMWPADRRDLWIGDRAIHMIAREIAEGHNAASRHSWPAVDQRGGDEAEGDDDQSEGDCAPPPAPARPDVAPM